MYMAKYYIDNNIKYNFNKGDYVAFRNYVNIDRVNLFNDSSNNTKRTETKRKLTDAGKASMSVS